MYRYQDIKHLHLEITSNCQAKCPQCARNYHGGIENPLLEIVDIDIDKFKEIVPVDFIKQLEVVSMCGNYGDPIINRDLIPIVEYIRQSDETTKVDIHTNGSARTEEWWKELAITLPENHQVNFALDGLADTHHLYRIGTDFDKIIKNAKAFIDAGGKARWIFIKFKHNQHQVDAAKQLAEQLGFDSFFEKETSRFIGDPWFDVLDKDGNVDYRLEGPTESKLVFVDRKTVENYQEIFKGARVTCAVEQEKSIYIDAWGRLWPCCFTGAIPYIYVPQGQLGYAYREDAKKQLLELVDNIGGLDFLKIENSSIREIVDSPGWQTEWDRGFDNNQPVCVRVCGEFDEPVLSQSKDQFIELEKFDE